ncbi:Riboflavin kinase [Carpediemonas membranifera]|uniref:riboflavin kinase n=1 Tax=Carpediemonas membranifera TaxID=201153 RepID=A0A8J6B2U1_9EUKA|nr:Riboflavin kinase [Carpediemonas membranifera]|eukprot:KAG9394518.1 Riboflavin kinase [Carpediemonas membranifera]
MAVPRSRNTIHMTVALPSSELAITAADAVREWESVDLVLQGPIVKGFGRGKSQLQCPTANLDPNAIQEDVKKILGQRMGVYAGYATFTSKNARFPAPGERYPMVMSIGTNPTYANCKLTIEAHLMHEFKEDFYGATLKLEVTHLIRTNTKFVSFEELKSAIFDDIKLYAMRLKKGCAII